MTAPLVLAHQGGWDEMLFVLVPLLIFAGLLAIARRRVDQMEASEQTDGSGHADEPDTSV